MRKRLVLGMILLLTLVGSCSNPSETSTPTPIQTPSSVVVLTHATKIAQLVGDYDREQQQPTLNQTWSRYKLAGTDLGVPFRHKDRTYLLFGDTVGACGGDAIAYTTDATPEDGIELVFVHDQTGVYKPVHIPGISQGAYEVPVEGVSASGRMYIYHTTDSTGEATMQQESGSGVTMGRSVVAVSDDDGQTFTYLYDFSTQHFINVSIVTADAINLSGLPMDESPVLVIFGSGLYRQSNVRLAFQPSDDITSHSSVRYFAGLDSSGHPILSVNEADAQPLFNQPYVGELSVSYNHFIHKWIMLYNCFQTKSRGINMRTADQPWGPWSEPQVLFQPWDDSGYGHFIHVSWQYRNCDSVHDPGRENVWGGEYGPYQFEDLAVGNETTTTIYFTMSTWNPYTVVLMKATLQKSQ